MLNCFYAMTQNLVSSDPSTNAIEIIEPLVPSAIESAVLSRTERTGFWFAHRMNSGVWKRLMTFCQRHIGSLWIYLATYNLMNVFGIENVENSDATNRYCSLPTTVRFSTCTRFQALSFAGLNDLSPCFFRCEASFSTTIRSDGS